MPLEIIRQDITKIECDAVVNPTNNYLHPGGGTDLAIHKAAGPGLLQACQKLKGCDTGKAKITSGFNLPCNYVIHTVGPDWQTEKNPEKVLASCYKECLALAVNNNCKSVAFPLISAGTHGFPEKDAIKIATKVIREFLEENDTLVFLVVYSKKAFLISEELFKSVKSYIDDNLIIEEDFCYSRNLSPVADERIFKSRRPVAENVMNSCLASPGLEDMLENMDKGFSDTLFYYIDKKGISDIDCYKRSNVDKKTFSKIKCNKNYKPSKKTAVSFAIGLNLNLEETSHLLRTAGFSLSNSNIFDVIIQYFVSTGNYETIFDVNEVLYQFDQVTLGV